MSDARTRVPAVEGWYTIDPDTPELIGSACKACGTIVFPPRATACPNPDCDSDVLEPRPLSRRGRVWSYTENHYAPPPPFVAPDPFEPYALAAVELEDDGIVVLGQVAKGVHGSDLRVGMDMELELDVLHRDDEHEYLVYVWAPAAPARTEPAPRSGTEPARRSGTEPAPRSGTEPA